MPLFRKENQGITSGIHNIKSASYDLRYENPRNIITCLTYHIQFIYFILLLLIIIINLISIVQEKCKS